MTSCNKVRVQPNASCWKCRTFAYAAPEKKKIQSFKTCASEHRGQSRMELGEWVASKSEAKQVQVGSRALRWKEEAGTRGKLNGVLVLFLNKHSTTYGVERVD